MLRTPLPSIQRWLQRHSHGAIGIAVAVPLMVLLTIQVITISRLKAAALLADRATLSNYVDTVLVDLVYQIGTESERALHVPAELVANRNWNDCAGHFRRNAFSGARSFFVARFEHGRWDSLLFYDRDLERMVERPPSDETRAAMVAGTSFQLFAAKGVEIDQARLQVEERDPSERVILYPLLDDSQQVIGVAGLILDEEYFRRDLLPTAVRQPLGRFFPDEMQDNVVVRVLDQNEQPVVATSTEPALGDEVSKPLDLVFKNWRLSVANRYPHPNQEARSQLWTTLLMFGGAALALLVGLTLALRTASREIRLSQMKSEFVSNVSHELRTPLASIRVFAEFLKSGRVQDQAKVQQYGTYIDAESRRLSGLVDNILDFSRIESGRKDYALEPSDPQLVVEGALTSFSVRAEQAGTPLDYKAPASALPAVRLDCGAFSQALHNLLDNAVKYSDSMQPIEVRLDRVGNEVVVAVTDHGIGISEGEQLKVFERFHRVGNSLVHDVKGAGLGLSIVHHVMQAHGGRVSVESQPGAGSTFRLHLPVVEQ